METWELVAREAIRDLVARYNADGDAGRIDAMMALFAPAAVLAVEDREHRGAEAIRALFEGVAAGTRAGRARYVRHFVATHQIDLEGPDRARGRAYFLVLTEAGLDHWGRYLDEYRCADGRWRFARRAVRVDGRVPGGWSDRTRDSLPEERERSGP